MYSERFIASHCKSLTYALNGVIKNLALLSLHVWKGVAAGLIGKNFTKDLQTINVPVWIFWGSKDTICFKADHENFTTNLKNGKLTVYEGTGHALHWEEPERFAADLLSFIKGI